MTESAPFNSSTAFCAKCGSILPLLQDFGSVQCYACKAVYDPDGETPINPLLRTKDSTKGGYSV